MSYGFRFRVEAHALLFTRYSLLLFLPNGLLDNYNASICAGHRAAHHQQIVLNVDPGHSQTFDRDSIIAHMTGRSNPLDHARRIGGSANRARRADVHRTVRLGAASEMVPLDRAVQASSL